MSKAALLICKKKLTDVVIHEQKCYISSASANIISWQLGKQDPKQEMKMNCLYYIHLAEAVSYNGSILERKKKRDLKNVCYDKLNGFMEFS